MKCYEYYAANSKQCPKKNCRYWLNSKEGGSCAVYVAKSGNKTLQDIGVIYDITRMRVCQIEKKIIDKIKKRVEGTLTLF